MVTSIQLGNFFTANGRSVLGGAGGSGLNTQALIAGLTQAKRFPAVALENKIKSNYTRGQALLQFQALLSTLKDTANGLRNPPGVNNAAANAFRYATAGITATGGVSGSSYISVGVAPGARLTSYTIDDIESLAASRKQRTGSFMIADADTSVVAATPAAGQFGAGTFTLNGEDITFNAGDSLNTVVGKFNAVQSLTGISAAIVQVADGEYQISFSATQSGTANSFDFNNLDVGEETTLVDGDNVFDQITVSNVQAASDAVFTLDGVEITRSTNSISDVIDKVTFTLLQPTEDGSELTININPDSQVAHNSIIDFVNAYNELRVFAARQTEVSSDGLFATSAVLATNQGFRSTMNSLSSQLNSIVSGLSGNLTRLADLGITFTNLAESADTPEVRNILDVDENLLASKIAGDMDAVRRVFEFDFTSDNPAVRVFSRTNALDVNSFTLNVNPFKVQTSSTIAVADADTDATTAGLLVPGTITINGQDVEIEAGDTLNEIAAKFTLVAAQTGIAVAVDEVDPGEFTLTFTSTRVAGGDNHFDLTSEDIDPDGVFGNLTFEIEAEHSVTYDDGGGPQTIEVDVTDLSNGGGLRIAGQEGTVLEGLVLLHTGLAASESEIDLTQGIGDKIYNAAEAALRPVIGTISVELIAIQSSDEKLAADIARIDEQVERFREQLLLKFSLLEQSLARINTLLQSIDAQNQARYAD